MKSGFNQFCFELFVIVPVLMVVGCFLGAVVGVMMGAK